MFVVCLFECLFVSLFIFFRSQWVLHSPQATFKLAMSKRPRSTGSGVPLGDVEVRVVASYLCGQSWKSARLVCRQWRDACDEVGLAYCGLAIGVPTEVQVNKLQKTQLSRKDVRKKEMLRIVLEKFGPKARVLDLSTQRVTTAAFLAHAFQNLLNLVEVKVFGLSGATYDFLFSHKPLRSISILDASLFNLGASKLRSIFKERDRGLDKLTLWNASRLSESQVDAMISASLEELSISNSKEIDISIFVVLQKHKPKLRKLALRNVASLQCPGSFDAPLNGPVLSFFRFLESVRLTLQTLDFSHSVPYSCCFPIVDLPALEYLYLDNTALDTSHLIKTSHRLKVLSMHQCGRLGDEIFRGALDEISRVIPERAGNSGSFGGKCKAPLQELVVARLSGTKVGEETVKRLHKLPSIRILLLEGCRYCPRGLRTRIRRESAVHNLPALAPGLAVHEFHDSDDE